jgi:hypothetical protein
MSNFYKKKTFRNSQTPSSRVSVAAVPIFNFEGKEFENGTLFLVQSIQIVIYV